MDIQTSGCETMGILKKFEDADPADSHHAPEEQSRGTQEQIVVEEVSSTMDEG